MTDHQAQYLLLFSGILAFAVLIQGVALVVLALAGAKLLKQVGDLTQEAKGKVYPLLDKVNELTAKGNQIAATARDFVEETHPKLNRIVDNVTETSDVYRAKVAQVDALITDTNDKARRQSDRVDGMVTDVLNKTTDVAHHLQQAILSPARQFSGLVSGAKVGIETLIHNYTSAKKPTPKPVAFEGESIYTGMEDDYHA